MKVTTHLVTSLTLTRLATGAQHPVPTDFVCVHPTYTIHLVSSSPLLIYIRGFLTNQERQHLHRISEDRFGHSAVGDDGKPPTGRTPQSAHVARDAVVECIEDRALAFQGFATPPSHLEPLQLVRYGPGEQDDDVHGDWFADPSYRRAASGGNRISTLFALVHVRNDTTGGGLNFPLISAPADDRWCDVVDCDEPWENGITFRPIEGNAVYWENLIPQTGEGDRRTLHAGLPLTSGEKLGLSVRTRQCPLTEEAREKIA